MTKRNILKLFLILVFLPLSDALASDNYQLVVKKLESKGKNKVAYVQLLEDDQPVDISTIDDLNGRRINFYLDGNLDKIDDLQGDYVEEDNLLIINFYPKPNNNYTLWANFKVNGEEYYASAPLIDRYSNNVRKITKESIHVKSSNYEFKLRFNNPLLQGVPTYGTVCITKDGKDISNLQLLSNDQYVQVMAFSADRKIAYPVEILSEDDASMNDDLCLSESIVDFKLTPKQPGMLKLFAKFKINNRIISVPFTVNVAANPSLSIDEID